MKTLTVQARLLAIGDLVQGARVTDVANSFRPLYLAVTLRDEATRTDRVMTVPRERWVQVVRDN